jgi:hypothetical protein
MMGTLGRFSWRGAIGLAVTLISISAGADRGGGRAANRTPNTNATRTSVHDQNVNVDRNVNVERNVNVDRDVNVHGGGHYDQWGHPIATAAAVTATAVAVGTMVAVLPTGCSAVGAYQKCGSTYYQPVQQGNNVQYVVTSPP